MCTSFTANVISAITKLCSVTGEPTRRNDRCMSSWKAFFFLFGRKGLPSVENTTSEWWALQKWNPTKRLIANTLLVVKTKTIYRNTRKCAKRWKQSSAFKQYLETLLVAIKMCTGFTTDVIWANTKEGSVTSDPNQSSSRRVSSLRDSSVLFNIWGVNFITVMSFYMLAVSQIRNHFKLE